MPLRGAFWDRLGQGITNASATFGGSLQNLRELEAQQERDKINAELTRANINRIGVDTKGAELDQAEKARKAELDKVGRMRFTDFMGREKNINPSFVPSLPGSAGVPMIGGLQLTPEQEAADTAAQKSALERLYTDPNFAQFGSTPEAKQYEAGLLALENLKDKDLERNLKLIAAGFKKRPARSTSTSEEWKIQSEIADDMKADPMVAKYKNAQAYLPSMKAVWTNLTPEEKKNKDKTAAVDNILIKMNTLMIEPGLAVREDDVRSVYNSQAEFDKAKGKFQAMYEGGLGFTKGYRDALVESAEKIFTVYQNAYKRRLKYYGKVANKYGIDPAPESGGIFDEDQWGLLNGQSEPGASAGGQIDLSKFTDEELKDLVRRGIIK